MTYLYSFTIRFKNIFILFTLLSVIIIDGCYCTKNKNNEIYNEKQSIIYCTKKINKIDLILSNLRNSTNAQDEIIHRICELEDSLIIVNEKLKLVLLKSLEKWDIDSTFNFILKQSPFFSVVQSPDKLLNVLSWNSGIGGTMIQYYLLAQAKKKKKGNVIKVLYDGGISDFPLYLNIYVDSLSQITIKNKIYYLLLGTGKLSTNKFQKTIQVISVNNNININDSILLTNNGEKVSHCTYRYQMQEIGKSFYPILKVDTSTNSITVACDTLTPK